jgi:putative hemolysin
MSDPALPKSPAPPASPALPTRRGEAAFDLSVREGAHIVDVLIEERCPKFANHPTWPLVRPVLHTMLGYRKARSMADQIAGMPGEAAFGVLSQMLQVRLEPQRLERIPATGRLVVVANHPTGLADGIAMWDLLRSVRRDVVFLANADALRVNPEFSDVIIPVEWVVDKRSPAKARETLRRAGEAFAQEKCVVIFPSGKLAKKEAGVLREQEWFSTFLSLARKQGAPIAPIGITAENSALFYALARVHKELRDITLFHELLNKRGAAFGMACGPLIDATKLSGEPEALSAALRDHVSYELTRDPDRAFGGL